jgi:hypothetical protein
MLMKKAGWINLQSQNVDEKSWLDKLTEPEC